MTWSTAPTVPHRRQGRRHQTGQHIIVVAGIPFGTLGANNMVRIALVGPQAGR
jgi:hypothetical protein